MPSRTPSGRPIPYTNLSLLVSGLTGLILRVSRGELVHPTIPSAAPYIGPDLVYIPIVDLPPMRSALIWRRPATDAKLREFIAVAREVLRARKPRATGDADRRR
jgi:hypothetical protein